MMSEEKTYPTLMSEPPDELLGEGREADLGDKRPFS
jgi:hypothetical protein